MKTKFSLRRRAGLVALAIALSGFGAATHAFAGGGQAEVNQALVQLNNTLTATQQVYLTSGSSNLTPTQLQTLIGESAIKAADLVADLNYILGTLNAAVGAGGVPAGKATVVTGIPKLLTGAYSVLNAASAVSSYFPQVVEALVTDSYYSNATGLSESARGYGRGNHGYQRAYRRFDSG